MVNSFVESEDRQATPFFTTTQSVPEAAKTSTDASTDCQTHNFRDVDADRGTRVRALLYLRPYSPGYNPIEEAFSKIEGLLRKAEARGRVALVEVVLEGKVHPTSVMSREGIKSLLERVWEHFRRLSHLWLDGGYNGARPKARTTGQRRRWAWRRKCRPAAEESPLGVVGQGGRRDLLGEDQ
jgi:hypothetical protein